MLKVSPLKWLDRFRKLRLLKGLGFASKANFVAPFELPETLRFTQDGRDI